MTSGKTSIYYSSVALLVIGAVVVHVIGAAANSAAFAEFRNGLHAPAFAVLTILFYSVLCRTIPSGRAMLISVGAVMATAVLGEIAQLVFQGRASAIDIARDTAGVTAALLTIFAFRKIESQRSHRSRRWLHKGIAAAAFIAILIPAWQSGQPLIARWQAYPNIVSFDHDWERSFFAPSNRAVVILDTVPADWPPGSGNLALIIPSAEGYSGIEIDPPSNWQGFTHLSFTIASGNDRELDVQIRIDDQGHNGNYRDRFGLELTVTPEPIVTRIPIVEIRDAPVGRSMDMRSIRSLIIFVADPTGDERLLLDDIRLEVT